MRPYPIPAEQWPTTPIVRSVNPLTGLIEGDDNGYRNMRTLLKNPSPLVVPDILIRASYDGVDECGERDSAIALPGGLRDGTLVVRETFARDLEDADKFLQNIFGGEYRLCALDGFRSWKRQAAGFTRMLRQKLTSTDLTDAACFGDPLGFLDAANNADGTFSFVNADVSSPQYNEAVRQINANTMITDAARAFAEAQTKKDPTNPVSYDDAVFIYITACVNAGIGGLPSMPLVFENNAHAGGGACDLFLVDRSGLPLNHVPFDWAGPEAGIDYLENEAKLEEYRAKLRTDSQLATYAAKLGIYHDTSNNTGGGGYWYQMRAAIRVLYHLSRAKGWTFYSSGHGGENWHFEGGNWSYDPVDGSVVRQEPLTSGYQNSGNPGHTLQLHGRDAVAVWGGASGHLAAHKWDLED